MRKIVYILCIFSLFLGASCGKIELDEGNAPGSGNGDKPAHPEHPVDPSTDTIRVSQLAEVANGQEVCLCAYVVGYIPSSSISKTQFTSQGAVRSNVVVADRPDETDYKKCAAVQLEADSEPRYDLNLADHPENIGAAVLLFGTKQKYYYAAGIKPLYDFEFLDDAYNDEPDAPGPSTYVFPIVSPSAPQVIEGH